MIGTVGKICDELGLSWRMAPRPGPEGTEVPLLELQHGPYLLWVVPGGRYVRVAFPIQLSDEEGRALRESGLQDEVVNSLSELLLEGRAGFRLDYQEAGDEERFLRQITLSQRVLVEEDDPGSLQRFLDAIQELVNVGMLCGRGLGRAFETFEAAGPGTDPGPMFH